MASFAAHMTTQLDLRKEAGYLRRLGSNFSADPAVVFPTVLHGEETHFSADAAALCGLGELRCVPQP